VRTKRFVEPPGTKPGGNFSQGILLDGTLHISGQPGEDAAGQISQNFEAEVTQALDNTGAVLKAAGMAGADVVSAQVNVTDAALFQRMNSVYTKHFKDPRPTSTPAIVSRLVGAGHIEKTANTRNSGSKGEKTCQKVLFIR